MPNKQPSSVISVLLLLSSSQVIINICFSYAYFIDLGAAYGTAKSGVGISSMGVLKPELIFQSIIPIIMAGILGIYGLIVSVILQQKSKCLPS
jgi:ATP synthase proteolipid subunit